MTGNNLSLIQLANINIIYWSVRSFRGRRINGVNRDDLFQPAAIITLSDFIAIWCNIQVLIFRLLLHNSCLLPDNAYPNLSTCNMPVSYFIECVHTYMHFRVAILYYRLSTCIYMQLTYIILFKGIFTIELLLYNNLCMLSIVQYCRKNTFL